MDYLYLCLLGPTSIDPPLISNIEARSADVTWTAPMEPNGIIFSYTLHTNNEVYKTVSSYR